jgi:hypothetical protein
MPSCSICALPTLAVVDRALVLGAETITALARRNGVSRQALLRHRAQHLPKALVEAHADDTPDRAALLLSELEALRSQVGGFIVAAQAKGDVRRRVSAGGIESDLSIIDTFRQVRHATEGSKTGGTKTGGRKPGGQARTHETPGFDR